MADTITINVKKELGIAEPFKLKTSNKNLRKVYELQLAMAEVSEKEEQANDSVEYAEAEITAINSVTSFIRDTLKLSDSQQEIVEELSTSESVLLANRICLRLQGYSDKDITAANKEEKEKNE